MLTEKTTFENEDNVIDTQILRDELGALGLTLPDTYEEAFYKLVNGDTPTIKLMDNCLPEELREYDPDNEDQVETYNIVNLIYYEKIEKAREKLANAASPESKAYAERVLHEYKWFLVMINHRWIYSLARGSYYWGDMNPDIQEDALQEAYLQAYEDVGRYDPEKGEITTYLEYSIKHTISSSFTESKGIKAHEYERVLRPYFKAKERLRETEFEADVNAPFLYTSMLHDLRERYIELVNDPYSDEEESFTEYLERLKETGMDIYALQEYMDVFYSKFRSPQDGLLKWSETYNRTKVFKKAVGRRIFKIHNLIKISNPRSMDQEQLIWHEDETGEPIDLQIDLTELVGLESYSPEELYDGIEVREIVEEALLKLDVASRNLLLFRQFGGENGKKATFEEVGNKFGISLSLARSRYRKIKLEFRTNILKPNEFIEKANFVMKLEKRNSWNMEEFYEGPLLYREKVARNLAQIPRNKRNVLMLLLGHASKDGRKFTVSEISKQQKISKMTVIQYAKEAQFMLLNLMQNKQEVERPNLNNVFRSEPKNVIEMLLSELSDEEKRIFIATYKQREEEEFISFLLDLTLYELKRKEVEVLQQIRKITNSFPLNRWVEMIVRKEGDEQTGLIK